MPRLIYHSLICAFYILLFPFAGNGQATSNPTVCATAGSDGPININGSINSYFPPAGTVTLPVGQQSITLAPVPATDAHGNNFGTIPIKAGDLLLIIQMQDATINYTNSTSYGSGNPTAGPDGLGATGYTNIGNSGKYEYVKATSNVPLTGGALTFEGSGAGNGTVYSYVNAPATSTAGKKSFQIIRIPQYSNLKLASNISPPPFNGNVGGVIAFSVSGNMDFNGFTIDVSGRGFRGGYSLIKNSVSNINDLYVALASDDRVSGKGEGIAGTPRYMWDGYNAIDNIIEGLPGGSGGRGAPANAGGGGNDSNAGGGGGGNGGPGGVGGGGYEPIGGTLPSGGRPGSTVPIDVTSLIMGAGGGGGHANDALTGVKGGVGGGIVLINAYSISGSGVISANGTDGQPGIYNLHPDGSGGGASGGTVFIKVSNPIASAVLTINANGGRGGNTQNDPGGDGVQPHGPGGGGGGGTVFYSIASGTVNVNVNAGKSGLTNNGAGIPHFAADGIAGVKKSIAIASLPPYLQGSNGICYPELVTTMKVTKPGLVKTLNDTVNFIITITNKASAGNAGGVQSYSALPSGISFSSATVRYTGAASGPVTIANQGTANAPYFGDFNIPAGDAVVIDLVVKIDCLPSGTYNSSSQAIYLDPTRLSTDPNRRITAATNAFPGSNTTYQAGPSGGVPGSNYNGAASTAEDIIVNNNPITNNTITPPAITGFCTAGDPSIIVGNVPSGGTGTYTYQWQSSPDNVTFTDISGASAKDYDPPVSSANIYYRRTVVSGGCATPLVSNVVGITISSPATNNVINYTITCINPSDVAVITGTVPVSGISVTYQWQNSTDGTTFTDITGATSQNYSPQVFSNTFYYRREVISEGCAVPSNIIKITTVSPIANNVITPSGLTEFCLNGDPGVITGTVPTGGDGNYTYQWQSSADNTGYSDIPGATSKDFDPPAATSDIYYRRMVLSNNCITPSVSNTIHIAILQNITNDVITAPAVASFCSSGDPGIITGNIPSGGNGIFLYQWQSSVDNNTFTDIIGATSQNFDPSVIIATTYYRRLSSSSFCGTPLTSNVVSIIISPSPATPSPLSPVVNVCPGNPATLAVSSPITGITYNWYDSASKTNHLFTGATYVTGPISVPTTFYVEATNGACSSPSLASVQVNLNSAPASPQVLPPSAVCNGSSASVSISNPQNGTTYNWYATATGGTSIFTGTDFITPALSNNATYYAEAANSGGCPSARTLVIITVYALPQVTAQGTSICPGLTANVTAGSTDEGAVINWYASAASGSILFTGDNYTTPVLNANTTYYAEAMNRSTGCVSATRSPALVQMIQPLAAPVVSVAETTTSSVTFKWDAVTGATGYQVSIDNGQTFTDPSSGSSGLTHTISNLQALQSVTIVVRATGASSCQLSGSSTAVTGAAVSPQGDNIYVANAFTPNGDSKNDIVYVHSPNIKSLKFYIYDQWGELLYTSLSPDNGWDGTYKGTKEPVGVYVYFVEAIMNDGHTVKKKGTITLLR